MNHKTVLILFNKINKLEKKMFILDMKINKLINKNNINNINNKNNIKKI